MKYISLTQGKVAIVDDTDFDELSRYKWQAWCREKGNPQADWYAVRGTPDGNVYMHCFIMGLIGVDHRDGDGLNNTRLNLRPATHAQNMRNRKVQANNTSGFKGVHRNSNGGKWTAKIKFNGVTYYIGSFADKTIAAHAYDAKAKELYGEFARPNFN